MSKSVRTYSAEDIQIIVGGEKVTGYADGTFVNVSRDEQAYQKTTGADGFTSRSRTANRAGTITLTLQSTSPANDMLSEWARRDEESDDGVFGVLVKDLRGGTTHSSPAGWIQQFPDDERSKEIGAVEWVIDCVEIDSFIGATGDGQAG